MFEANNLVFCYLLHFVIPFFLLVSHFLFLSYSHTFPTCEGKCYIFSFPNVQFFEVFQNLIKTILEVSEVPIRAS